MDSVAERGLWLGPEYMAAHRADLATFVDQAMRLDDAAVIRLRARSDGVVTAWAATGFDVLASRVVAGRVRPDDMSVGADALARGLAALTVRGYVDPGSRWIRHGGALCHRNPVSPTSTTYRQG